MDGNGRWAKSKNHNRLFGHVKGAQRAKWMVETCSQLKLSYLSLFALSAENLSRPKGEIKALQTLLEKVFVKHSDFLMEKQIKLSFLGDLSVFSSQLKSLCENLCKKTKNNQGLNLIIALNYGGKQEILQAFQKMAKKIKTDSMTIESLSEKDITPFFASSQFPDPDLIIRTGGELRLSNFYLWSASYSEFYFTETLWPDFNKSELSLALKRFEKTKRRYGKI